MGLLLVAVRHLNPAAQLDGDDDLRAARRGSRPDHRGALRGERIDPQLVTASSLWAGVYLVAASIAGHSAYTWLLSSAPMSLVSTYAYINPVVAVRLGFLIIGESITSDVIVGLTVAVGGVVLVVSGERRQ